MMEDYLLQLLDTNHRVIVPDLGAFILRQKEPRELVFNDLLAFNDGMLADLVQQEENITGKQALEKIESFVVEIKKVMEKGDPYVLKGIGLLTMDEGSRISFAVNPEEDPGPPLVRATSGSDTLEKTESPAGEEAAEPPVKPEEPEVEATEEKSPPQEPPDQAVGTIEKATSEMKAGEVGSPPEWEDQAESAEPEEEGFELEDLDHGVEVDATDESHSLEPDREEAPFTIEEAEEPQGDELPDDGSSRISAAAEASAASLTGDPPTPPPAAPSEEEPLTSPGPAAGDIPSPEESEAEPAAVQPGPEAGPESEAVPETPYGGPAAPAAASVARDRDTADHVPRYRRSEFRQPAGRKALPWIAGIVGLLVVLLILGWFLFPEQRDWLLNRDQDQGVSIGASGSADPSPFTTESPAGAITETPASSDPASQAPATKVTPAGEPEVPAATSGQRFYIIAGVFAQQSNADDLLNRLRAQGYDAEIFRRRGSLYAVSYRAHATRSAALRDLETIRREADPEAWLLQY